MKTTVVLFVANTARILVNPESDYTGVVNAVINPSLTAVKGIPPHFWKLVEGKILPMDETERKERLKSIVRLLPPPKHRSYHMLWKYLAVSGWALICAYAAYTFINR